MPRSRSKSFSSQHASCYEHSGYDAGRALGMFGFRARKVSLEHYLSTRSMCSQKNRSLSSALLTRKAVINSLSAVTVHHCAHIFFCSSISSILNSRFLLALHEANAHLERGGTTASSTSALDFGRANPEAMSSELPEFISAIARTIHSIPFDDFDMVNSKPTLQPEIEVEVVALEEGSTGEAGASEMV